MIPLSEFVHELRSTLDKVILQEISNITDNRAPDYETYATHFGYLNGVREARRQIDELVKKINDGG